MYSKAFVECGEPSKHNKYVTFFVVLAVVDVVASADDDILSFDFRFVSLRFDEKIYSHNLTKKMSSPSNAPAGQIVQPKQLSFLILYDGKNTLSLLLIKKIIFFRIFASKKQRFVFLVVCCFLKLIFHNRFKS